jgi:biopolymer transport protein ExbD
MRDERFSDETMQPLLRSKTYDESDMDITPMIDITFLLLIFFIVASKMDAAADVSLPPARYGMPVVEKSSVVITLDAGEDGKAIVYKGNGASSDNVVPSTDLEAQEDEIAGYVETEMSQDNTKTNVLIKAAKGIKHREVTRISKAATRSEYVQQLYVAVMEVQ